MILFVKSRLLQFVLGILTAAAPLLVIVDPALWPVLPIAGLALVWQFIGVRAVIRPGAPARGSRELVVWGVVALPELESLPIREVLLMPAGHAGVLRFGVWAGDPDTGYLRLGVHDTAAWPGFRCADRQARRVAWALGVPARIDWRPLSPRLRRGGRQRIDQEARTGAELDTPFADRRGRRLKLSALTWGLIPLLGTAMAAALVFAG